MATESNVLARAQPIAKRRASRKPWGAITLFLAPAMIFYTVFILYHIAETFL